MRSRCWSVLPAAVVLALGVASASASADSIVLLKDSNVWLTSPDGASAYAVTSDGGWSSPSQSDDGTIVAQKGSLLVRMDRSGRALGAPVRVPGAVGALNRPGVNFFGPYDPRVSPDGRRIAYWFKTQDATKVPGGVTSDIQDWSTTTASDHFDADPQTSVSEQRMPHWIGSTRLLLTDPFGHAGDQVSTWLPTGGFSSEQAWFAAHNGVVQDGEVSPDGTRLTTIAATDGLTSPFNKLVLWKVDGPAWIGEPPYAASADAPHAASPTATCAMDMGTEAHSPSWSPPSDRVALDNQRGVWIASLDAAGTCSGLDLLVAGGSAPDWGPADVDPAQAPTAQAAARPAPPAQPGTTAPQRPSAPKPSPGGGAPPTAVRLSPSHFRASGGARLRFHQAVAGPVTLTVSRACAALSCRRALGPVRRVEAVVGANSVHITGHGGGHRLARGRYWLLVHGGGTTVRVAFRIGGAR
jgi:hypothetical protein